MTNDEKLMQQALDALTYIYTETTEDEDELIHAAINALRVRLAQPEPEPVAIVQQETFGRGQVLWIKPASEILDGTPLYTAPPQREWQGLTDEEIEQGNKESWVTKQAWESAVWWAEAKLKEKNT